MSSAWNVPTGQSPIGDLIFAAEAATATKATLALDSPYLYVTTGDAFMGTFVPAVTGNLTDFWVNVDSYTGTWASTDRLLNVEIRAGIGANFIPGTTLVGSFTVDLTASPTGWVKTTGLTIALTAGRVYSVVVGDADGSAGNYATVVARLGASSGFVGGTNGGTTTNGWTSASGTNGAAAWVTKVAGYIFSGNTIDTRVGIASSTNETGGVLIPPEDCMVAGVYMNGGASILFGAHTFKLYASGSNPGGATLGSWTPGTSGLGAGTTVQNFIVFDPTTWVNLTRGTTYRFVIDPASALTIPAKSSIAAAGIDADIKKTWPLGGGYYWTIESAGAWVDDTAAVADFGPILVPRATGGGGLLVHPGMAGGMRG